MCSTYEEGELEKVLMPKVRPVAKECMKCKLNAPQVVIRVNDAFCRQCFLQYCTHKFRSSFGKSKLVRDGEKVLLAFSGGHASTAMLHLVMEGKSVRAQKKLRFVPGLLFIDEGGCLGWSDEYRSTICVKVNEIFTSSGYPHHIANLEQLFDECEDRGTPAQQLHSLFISMTTYTAKEQLLKTLRRQLMIRVAKAQGYSKVIVANTSSNLSVAILSSMAQGKGAHISYDTSLLDDRDPFVSIIRPMKDFTAKEVSIYNRFNSLQVLVLKDLTSMRPAGASIDKLTESFVTGLQNDFPSTVNTIMRTGEKLVNSGKSCDMDCKEMCVICKAPLDTSVPTSSALGSVDHSQKLSLRRLAEQTNRDVNITANSSDVVRNSCYSCQQMLKDLPILDSLPEALTVYQTNRQHMRAAIADNLL